MSKIKTLVPDDFTVDDDNMSGRAQDAAELKEFEDSIQGKLICFTTQELQDEMWRRMFEPYISELARLKDTLDNMKAPF